MKNNYFWISAFVIGTLLNAGLFLILPGLGRTEPVIKPQVISVEFMAWQQPAEKKPAKLKPIPRKKPKPVKKRKQKPKPKNKPKPVIKKPPKVVKMPVLSETVIPKKSKPEPVEEAVVVEPIIKQKRPSEAEQEEVLPVPSPIFKLTSMPRVLHQATLIYPPAMQAQGKEATVKLEILLDLKGKIRRVTIIKSGGEAFDKAAIAAMKNSTFLPGNINGKPVAVLLKKKIRFRLQ